MYKVAEGDPIIYEEIKLESNSSTEALQSWILSVDRRGRYFAFYYTLRSDFKSLFIELLFYICVSRKARTLSLLKLLFYRLNHVLYWHLLWYDVTSKLE